MQELTLCHYPMGYLQYRSDATINTRHYTKHLRSNSALTISGFKQIKSVDS